jgi:exocyst complex component 4
MSTSISALHLTQTTRNPESDSFAYIETLLESLAVLGKLGSALDIVAQRLPSEIFTLVEITLDEVAERAEYGRRGSVVIPGVTTGRSDGVYIIPDGNTRNNVTNIPSPLAPRGGFLVASSLRLAALESSAKRVDHETLKDFFWTVYSKLDAISQGLRIVYEVSNRIGSVGFSTCAPNY